MLTKAEGRKNRKKGLDFEKKVRATFEENGWTVAKWSNTVKDGQIIKAPAMFFGNRIQTTGVGFPDFVAFRPKESLYEVCFIECKWNGELRKDEKEKIAEYKRRGFVCWLAYPDEDDGRVLLSAL